MSSAGMSPALGLILRLQRRHLHTFPPPLPDLPLPHDTLGRNLMVHRHKVGVAPTAASTTGPTIPHSTEGPCPPITSTWDASFELLAAWINHNGRNGIQGPSATRYFNSVLRMAVEEGVPGRSLQAAENVLGGLQGILSGGTTMHPSSHNIRPNSDTFETLMRASGKVGAWRTSLKLFECYQASVAAEVAAEPPLHAGISPFAVLLALRTLAEVGTEEATQPTIKTTGGGDTPWAMALKIQRQFRHRFVQPRRAAVISSGGQSDLAYWEAQRLVLETLRRAGQAEAIVQLFHSEHKPILDEARPSVYSCPDVARLYALGAYHAGRWDVAVGLASGAIERALQETLDRLDEERLRKRTHRSWRRAKVPPSGFTSGALLGPSGLYVPQEPPTSPPPSPTFELTASLLSCAFMTLHKGILGVEGAQRWVGELQVCPDVVGTQRIVSLYTNVVRLEARAMSVGVVAAAAPICFPSPAVSTHVIGSDLLPTPSWSADFVNSPVPAPHRLSSTYAATLSDEALAAVASAATHTGVLSVASHAYAHHTMRCIQGRTQSIPAALIGAHLIALEYRCEWDAADGLVRSVARGETCLAAPDAVLQQLQQLYEAVQGSRFTDMDKARLICGSLDRVKGGLDPLGVAVASLCVSCLQGVDARLSTLLRIHAARSLPDSLAYTTLATTRDVQLGVTSMAPSPHIFVRTLLNQLLGIHSQRINAPAGPVLAWGDYFTSVVSRMRACIASAPCMPGPASRRWLMHLMELFASAEHREYTDAVLSLLDGSPAPLEVSAWHHLISACPNRIFHTHTSIMVVALASHRLPSDGVGSCIRWVQSGLEQTVLGEIPMKEHLIEVLAETVRAIQRSDAATALARLFLENNVVDTNGVLTNFLAVLEDQYGDVSVLRDAFSIACVASADLHGESGLRLLSWAAQLLSSTTGAVIDEGIEDGEEVAKKGSFVDAADRLLTTLLNVGLCGEVPSTLVDSIVAIAWSLISRHGVEGAVGSRLVQALEHLSETLFASIQNTVEIALPMKNSSLSQEDLLYLSTLDVAQPSSSPLPPQVEALVPVVSFLRRALTTFQQLPTLLINIIARRPSGEKFEGMRCMGVWAEKWCLGGLQLTGDALTTLGVVASTGPRWAEATPLLRQLNVSFPTTPQGVAAEVGLLAEMCLLWGPSVTADTVAMWMRHLSSPHALPSTQEIFAVDTASLRSLVEFRIALLEAAALTSDLPSWYRGVITRLAVGTTASPRRHRPLVSQLVLDALISESNELRCARHTPALPDRTHPLLGEEGRKLITNALLALDPESATSHTAVTSRVEKLRLLGKHTPLSRVSWTDNVDATPSGIVVEELGIDVGSSKGGGVASRLEARSWMRRALGGIVPLNPKPAASSYQRTSLDKLLSSSRRCISTGGGGGSAPQSTWMWDMECVLMFAAACLKSAHPQGIVALAHALAELRMLGYQAPLWAQEHDTPPVLSTAFLQSNVVQGLHPTDDVCCGTLLVAAVATQIGVLSTNMYHQPLFVRPDPRSSGGHADQANTLVANIDTLYELLQPASSSVVFPWLVGDSKVGTSLEVRLCGLEDSLARTIHLGDVQHRLKNVCGTSPESLLAGPLLAASLFVSHGPHAAGRASPYDRERGLIVELLWGVQRTAFAIAGDDGARLISFADFVSQAKALRTIQEAGLKRSPTNEGILALFDRVASSFALKQSSLAGPQGGREVVVDQFVEFLKGQMTPHTIETALTKGPQGGELRHGLLKAVSTVLKGGSQVMALSGGAAVFTMQNVHVRDVEILATELVRAKGGSANACAAQCRFVAEAFAEACQASGVVTVPFVTSITLFLLRALKQDTTPECSRAALDIYKILSGLLTPARVPLKHIVIILRTVAADPSQGRALLMLWRGCRSLQGSVYQREGRLREGVLPHLSLLRAGRLALGPGGDVVTGRELILLALQSYTWIVLHCGQDGGRAATKDHEVAFSVNAQQEFSRAIFATVKELAALPRCDTANDAEKWSHDEKWLEEMGRLLRTLQGRGLVRKTTLSIFLASTNRSNGPAAIPPPSSSDPLLT